MNRFVAEPDWGWWIIGYFFLGGIAAGAYFTATLLHFAGTPADQPVARWGFRLACPLIAVCGLFLTLDLTQPLRFWHMLFRSEVVHGALAAGWPFSGAGWSLMVQAPLLKVWSPMSAGSWALTVFGLCSGISFLGALYPEGRMAQWFLHSWFGRGAMLLGCGVAFFVASYTGVLLTASNQPLWAENSFLGPLFLTSAASTALATLTLLTLWERTGTAGTLERLRHAEMIAIVLEGAAYVAFLYALPGGPPKLWMVKINSASSLPLLTGEWMLVGVGIFGLVVPGILHLAHRRLGDWTVPTAAVMVLLAGFVLRWGVVHLAPEILHLPLPPPTNEVAATPGAPLFNFSPEDGRRALDRGADPGNDVGGVRPRSKFNEKGR